MLDWILALQIEIANWWQLHPTLWMISVAFALAIWLACLFGQHRYGHG
jgi:hypothetical protein